MGKPIYIGVGSQKGGVGKSTIAEIMASVFHYGRGYNLLVIDCDEAQNSFAHLRKRDHFFLSAKESKMGGALKEVFLSYNKKAYSVVPSTREKALNTAEEWTEGGGIDIVIFDLPGRLDNADLLIFSLSMDYIISPIEPDIQSLKSSLTYLKTLQASREQLDPSIVKIKDVIAVWNKVNRSVRFDAIELFSPKIKELNVNLLGNMLYQSKKFSLELGEARDIKEVFRCTYLAPTPLQMEGTGLKEVLDDIENIVFKADKV